MAKRQASRSKAPITKCARQHRIDEATARTLAVEAGVDPRTIKKVDRGEEVVGMAGERARAALARHRAGVALTSKSGR